MDRYSDPSQGKIGQEENKRTLCGLRGADALHRCSALDVRWRGGDLRSERRSLVLDQRRRYVSSILRLIAPCGESRLRRHDCLLVPLLIPRIHGAVRRDAVAVSSISRLLCTVVCTGEGREGGREEGGGRDHRGNHAFARRLTNPPEKYI